MIERFKFNNTYVQLTPNTIQFGRKEYEYSKIRYLLENLDLKEGFNLLRKICWFLRTARDEAGYNKHTNFMCNHRTIRRRITEKEKRYGEVKSNYIQCKKLREKYRFLIEVQA